ncbi:MFS transporter [Streptomyces griseoruber]|uniref:MFS transporter n=1 Tax=Streptomyces griseoruber TaxID=1943 RepID=UPI0037BBF69F
MTASPISPGPLAESFITPSDTEHPPVGKSFIFAFAFAYAGFWIACLTPGTVSLALKVQALVGSEDAASTLSAVVGVGVLLPLLLMPDVGRLSDRTTARMGMRRPYLLAGAAGVVALGAVMGLAPNVPVLLAAFALYSVAANLIGTPLLAVIADRVPVRQRGLVSGLVGLTLPLAVIGGTFIVQAVAADTLLMFLLPPLIAAVSVLVFIALVRVMDSARAWQEASTAALRTANSRLRDVNR